MGLVMLIGSLLIITLVIVFARKTKGYSCLLLILLVPIVTIPSIIMTNGNVPQNYTCKAIVTMPDFKVISPIYFESFKQDGNKITITKYAEQTIHWLDFKFYDERNRLLTIILTDNDNKFIYTERNSGETFYDNKIATQP